MRDTHLRPLCETRWVFRVPSLKAFVDLFSVLMDWFENMLHDSDQNANMRSKALGHLQNMEKFLFFILAQILLRIFETVHPLHVKVQGREVTIGETKREFETLVDILSADGGIENTAEAFYRVVKDKSQESNIKKIDLPTLPRGHANARFGGKRMELEISEEELQYTTLVSSSRFLRLPFKVCSADMSLIIWSK